MDCMYNQCIDVASNMRAHKERDISTSVQCVVSNKVAYYVHDQPITAESLVRAR